MEDPGPANSFLTGEAGSLWVKHCLLTICALIIARAASVEITARCKGTEQNMFCTLLSSIREHAVPHLSLFFFSIYKLGRWSYKWSLGNSLCHICALRSKRTYKYKVIAIKYSPRSQDVREVRSNLSTFGNNQTRSLTFFPSTLPSWWVNKLSCGYSTAL